MINGTINRVLRKRIEYLNNKYGDWKVNDPEAWDIFVKDEIEELEKALKFMEDNDMDLLLLQFKKDTL